MIEIGKAEILDWVSSSDADERAGRSLLVDTAIRVPLIDRERELTDILTDAISEIDIIKGALRPKTKIETVQPRIDFGFGIPAVSIDLRDKRKASSDASSKKPNNINGGYVRFRESIQEVTGVHSKTAGAVASLITRPKYINPYWPEAIATYKGMFQFSAEDDPSYLVSKKQIEFSDKYPKSVTIDHISHGRLISVPGIGPDLSQALIKFLRHYTTQTDVIN